jgi:hypothetical protein
MNELSAGIVRGIELAKFTSPLAAKIVNIAIIENAFFLSIL